MYEVCLFLSVVTFLLVGAAFYRTGAFSVFHPLTFYMAFHGLVFVIRPIFAEALDYSIIYRAYQFSPSMSDKITVILAANLGLIAFACAALYSGNVKMQFKLDRPLTINRELLRPSFVWVIIICCPIALYSLAKVWNGAATTGIGYEGMTFDPVSGGYYNTTGNGYVAEAQLMLATCCAMTAWLFRFRLLALMPLIAFALLRAGTGGRGPFITGMVTVSLLWLYEHRRRFPSMRVLLLVACLFPVFTAVGDDRGASIRRAITGDSSSEIFGLRRSNEKFMEGMDYANLEFFEYLVYVIPNKSGTYGYFLDNLQLFTEPIPRVLWKGKPLGAPFNRIYLFSYGKPVGMTKSLPGEGWYSLGWLGVALWCALWGWLLGTAYRKFVLGPQNSFQVLIYMMFLPILIIAYRDGGFVTIARQGLFFIGPIVLWQWIARRSLAGSRSWVLGRTSGDSPQSLATQHSPQQLPPAVQRRRIALTKSP